MAVSPRIAIDAMGGDIGPAVMVAGMARARRKDRSLRFDVFGDEAQYSFGCRLGCGIFALRRHR